MITNNNRRGQITFTNFISLLLGRGNASTFGEGINTRNLRAADYSFFVQDDWKFSPKLTLNVGLRYELDLPPYETRGALSTFDPSLYRPELDSNGNVVVPPINGFVQAGNVIPQYDLPNVPNVSKGVLTSIDPNNFAPRIGFAYSPLKSARLVLRGGYGIFYSRPSAVYIAVTINTPPTYAIVRSPAGAVVQLANPYVSLPPQDQFPTFVSGLALSGQVFESEAKSINPMMRDGSDSFWSAWRNR